MSDVTYGSNKLPPEKKNPIREAMNKYLFIELRVVRVWSELDHPTCLPSVEATLRTISKSHNYEERWTCRAIAERIEVIEGVTAVEVLNLDGDGVVFYPDWK